jgi:hypothetical protein
MNRKALTTTVVLVLGLGLAGCTPALADRSYSLVRDGAQKALSVTFSVSAAVTTWLAQTPQTPQTPETPPCPPCDKARRS